MHEIKLYKFSYKPFETLAGSTIRWVDVWIQAETRKEAELIALDSNYKFFNQDCTVVVTEELTGYSQ